MGSIIRPFIANLSYPFTVVLLFGIVLSTLGQSQEQTVQLSLSDIAVVSSLESNTNFSGSSEDEYIALTSTNSGTPYTKRTYFNIDLSSIPSNATIHSATLYLFGKDHQTVADDFNGLIAFPAASWQDDQLVWNNQPSVPLTNAVLIPDATSGTHNASLDFTSRIRNLVYFPGTYSNYGYCLRLDDEEPVHQFIYHSEHVGTSSLEPYLEVTYEVPQDLIHEFNTQLIDQEEENTGAISIAISQGNPPYTYNWSDGSITVGTESFVSGLSAGTYSLTVTDNIDRDFTFEIAVGYDPSWVDHPSVDNYRALGTVLERASGPWSWGEAMGSGAILPAGEDGWIEYTVEDTEHKMFGFAKPSDYHLGYSKIQAGLYLKDNRDFRKIKSGTEASIGSYDIGDIVRIEKSGETFNYYLNGVLKGSHTVTGINSEELLIEGTLYKPKSRFSNIRSSLRKKFDVRLYVENQREGITDGDIFALPRYGEKPYTYSWSNGATEDRIQGLAAGNYTVTVTDDNGLTATKTTEVYVDPDKAMNWQSSKSYDDEGNLLGAGKSFTDFNGKALQAQSIETRTLTLFANQQVYDNVGRAVISTLSAPTFHDRLDFQSSFFTATDGNNYDVQHFDVADYTTNSSTLTEGEIHKPFKARTSQKGELGWYYSDNNNIEPYQDRTDYPFSRIVYGQYDPRQTVESSIPHDSYKMGSGKESKNYTLPVVGEFTYMYGYGHGWELGKDFEITPNASSLGGIGTILTEYLQYDYRATKVINYSSEGKESVVFISDEGAVIASARSGTNEAGVNDYEMNVRSIIRGPANGQLRYVDIHIPEGCESSLELQNSKGLLSHLSFDIIDLISGETVLESCTLNTPNPALAPGIYRIVDRTYDSESELHADKLPDINIDYKLNYYDFSLNYYDKNNKVRATVDPEGYDYNYSPQVDINSVMGFQDFIRKTNNTDWEFDNENAKFFSETITVPATDEQQFTNVTLYLTTDDQVININSPEGDDVYIYDPLYEDSTEGPGGGPMESALTYSFSSTSSTPFSGGTAVIGPGGGTTPVPTCVSGTYAATQAAVENVCNANQIAIPAPLGRNGINGYCVTCIAKPVPPDPNKECSQMAEKPYDHWFRMVFEVNAISTGSTTQVSTLQLYAKVKNGIWTFSTPSEQIKLNTSILTAASAVVGTELSKTATKVEIELVDLDYQSVQANAENCDWDILYWGRIDRPDLTDLPIDFEQLRLYFEVSTHNMDEFPDHQIYSTYNYNSIGQLLLAENADEGETEYIYTYDGLLRFSQSSQQAIDEQFAYTNYDNLGRPTEMGVVLGGTATPTVTYANAQASQVVENINEITKDGTNVIPDGYLRDKTQILYDVKDVNQPTTYDQNYLRGRVSKVWNENTTTWYSYLSDGRLDWTAQRLENWTGTDDVKTIHYTYDKLGNVETIIFQKDDATEYFEHKYEYNRIGMLRRAYTRTSTSAAYIEEAQYRYDIAGQLKRVEIAENLQGIDYTYNVLGMLKAINSPNLGVTGHNKYFVDPGRDGQNGTHTDIFGMSFDYFNGDYSKDYTKIISGTAQKEYIDGQIAAVRWNTSENPAATDKQMAFDFDYFKNGWMKSAYFTTVGDFGSNQTPPTTATGSFGDNSVSGLTYDRNGNIKSLIRKGYTSGSTTQDMDDFTYQYDPDYTNRLVFVEDDITVNTGYTTDIEDQGGDLLNETTWTYIYDAEGRLITDKDEQLKYHYNALGLVERIERNHGSGYRDLLKFEYDNMGLRNRKIIHDNNGTAVTYVWYIRDASGAEVAKYEETVGGSLNDPSYPIIGDARLGDYDKASNQRTYEMMDHLGNVRATFRRDISNGVLVTSYADYYPFGSPLPGRNQISSPQYEHGYQGQFTTKDEETGLDAFQLRMWDSRLARWTSTDPYGQFASPYLGMGNNPISGVDPDGGFWGMSPALSGAVVGAVGGGIAGGIAGGKDGVWKGALAGAALGAGIGYGIDGGFSGLGKSIGSFGDKALAGIGNSAKHMGTWVSDNAGTLSASLFNTAVQTFRGSADVFIETDGIGHAYLRVKGAVFSYGRYNGSYSPALGAFGPVGDGVLLKYTGSQARQFIKSRTSKFPTNQYTISGINANATYNFFNDAYNAGTPLENGGRLINTYTLLGNNCATSVCNGLRAGGSSIPVFQTPATLNGFLHKVRRIGNGWNPGALQPGEPKF